MSYHVSVDVGTSYTAAAIIRTEGAQQEPQILPLGLRATSMPSLVFIDDDGSAVVGETAERRGMLRPECLAREFKRRIGDDVPLVMGGNSVLAEDLFAMLVGHVVDLAEQREGEPAASITVTHPAAWGEHRITSVQDALVRSGIGEVLVITEPEAAALAYAAQQRVAPGSTFAVYDLGGGTFDATVLAKTADAFTVLGEPSGLERLGGADFDQRVFAHVIGSLPEGLTDLDPSAPGTVQALTRLRRECSEAKEALSADADATIPGYLPGGQALVRLTRSEFEAMIEPDIRETIDVLRAAMDRAQVNPEDVSAILLIGGSSRIPFVAQLLSEEFERPLAVDADPKASIALGAAFAAGALEEDRVGSSAEADPAGDQGTDAAGAEHGTARPFVPQHGPVRRSAGRRTGTRAALVLGAVALLGVATATAAGLPTPLSALTSLAGGERADAARSGTVPEQTDASDDGVTAEADEASVDGLASSPGPTLLDRVQETLSGGLSAEPSGSGDGARTAGADQDERSASEGPTEGPTEEPTEEPTDEEPARRGAETIGPTPEPARSAATDPTPAARSTGDGSMVAPAPSAVPGKPPRAPAPGTTPVAPSPSVPSPSPDPPVVAPSQEPTTEPTAPVPVEPTTPAPPSPAPGSIPVEPLPEPPAPTPAPGAGSTDPTTAPGSGDAAAGEGNGARAEPAGEPEPPDPQSTPAGTPVPSEG
ncbi:Hsp70 family protein [Arthrobacter echini]|uniref:Hsp70 family protein n=1 Tax=Arthrobacter echini TaxID=1529066 RepID=A0A4S5E8K0_9MICC|nr:Hsp70 family protein [Arthrobacter echini]THJ67862.1 Hsp70 family protein [Arthrobacter echini]